MRPGRDREIVGHLQANYEVSERRACKAFPIHQSTKRYQSRRPDQAPLKMGVKELAETRARYGYRRNYVLLQREGWRINHNRTHRLYNEMGLQRRKKAPKTPGEGKASRESRPRRSAERLLVDGRPVRSAL